MPSQAPLVSDSRLNRNRAAFRIMECEALAPLFFAGLLAALKKAEKKRSLQARGIANLACYLAPKVKPKGCARKAAINRRSLKCSAVQAASGR